MDEDKTLNPGVGLPASGSSSSMNSEASGSSSSPPLAPSGMSESQSGFSDFQMPESPPRILGHRRTQSMIFPDNFLLDTNHHKFPSDTKEHPVSKHFNLGEFFLLYGRTIALQASELSSSAAASPLPRKPPTSISVALPPKPPTSKLVAEISDKPRRRHLLIKSMDGSTTLIKPEYDDELAELSSNNIKHAKRLLSNRSSAARSRDKRMQYIADLERAVRILQNEAASLSLQMTALQRDNAVLTAENRELRLQLQDAAQRICHVGFSFICSHKELCNADFFGYLQQVHFQLKNLNLVLQGVNCPLEDYSRNCRRADNIFGLNLVFCTSTWFNAPFPWENHPTWKLQCPATRKTEKLLSSKCNLLSALTNIPGLEFLFEYRTTRDDAS